MYSFNLTKNEQSFKLQYPLDNSKGDKKLIVKNITGKPAFYNVTTTTEIEWRTQIAGEAAERDIRAPPSVRRIESPWLRYGSTEAYEIYLQMVADVLGIYIEEARALDYPRFEYFRHEGGGLNEDQTRLNEEAIKIRDARLNEDASETEEARQNRESRFNEEVRDYMEYFGVDMEMARGMVEETRGQLEYILQSRDLNIMFKSDFLEFINSILYYKEQKTLERLNAEAFDRTDASDAEAAETAASEAEATVRGAENEEEATRLREEATRLREEATRLREEEATQV